MTISEVLSAYGEGHAPTTADPVRIGCAIEALDRFWVDLTVSAITKATCRRYCETRVTRTGTKASNGTTRRELGVLQAALNYCKSEGMLVTAPSVHLPEKPPAKERWLTRQEMAWLLRASRKLRSDGRHLSRFILAGRYTGTRKEAILGLRIDTPSLTSGWVDTVHGTLYRRGTEARQTKKRQPPARLPAAFIGHVRRWKANGARFVVETRDHNRIGDIKKGWASACQIAETLAAKKGIVLDMSDVTPHTLRHTAITWAMQAGAEMWHVAGYFGVSMETLQAVYAHHHPDHQQSAVRAMGNEK